MSEPAAPKKQKKPPAFVLVGLPGSGKSTWAKNHPARLPIASGDVFIEEFARKDGITYAEAFKKYYKKSVALMKKRVGELVDAGGPFIWDQTNLERKERDGIYGRLHKTHEVVFVCFLVPLDVCLAQHKKRQAKGRDGGNVVDEKRIRYLAGLTEFPVKGDKCDKIVNIIHPEWKRPERKK